MVSSGAKTSGLDYAAMRSMHLALLIPMLGLASMDARQSAPASARVETVATLPSMGSTENLCQTQDGNIYITALDEQAIWKVDARGNVSRFTSVPSMVAIVGIAPTDSNGVVVTAFARPYRRPGATAADFTDVGSNVLVFDNTGKLLDTIPSPQPAAFNGITSIGGGAYLIADSNPGSVWRFELPSKRLSQWLKDPQLAPGGNGTGIGANGIKVHGGWAYVGVSSSNAIYRVQLAGDGGPSGALMKWAEGFRPDDFDLARDGTLYAPNGMDGAVYRVTPKGEVSKFLDGVPGGAAGMIGRDGKLYWGVRGGTMPSRLLRMTIP
jgi:hypothetical protein